MASRNRIEMIKNTQNDNRDFFLTHLQFFKKNITILRSKFRCTQVIDKGYVLVISVCQFYNFQRTFSAKSCLSVLCLQELQWLKCDQSLLFSRPASLYKKLNLVHIVRASNIPFKRIFCNFSLMILLIPCIKRFLSLKMVLFCLFKFCKVRFIIMVIFSLKVQTNVLQIIIRIQSLYRQLTSFPLVTISTVVGRLSR